MPEQGKERDLLSLVPGALSGENNGLSLLLDAETFDYGNGFYDLGVRAGEGFKVALVHPLDMPNIQQMGINVMPGAITQIATSINLIDITSAALQKFSPKERKCWTDEEITLTGLNYSDGYRYTMNNCLYEATMQVAYKNCSCYPGKKSKLKLQRCVFFFSGFMMASNVSCLAGSLHCFNEDFYYLGKQPGGFS